MLTAPDCGWTLNTGCMTDAEWQAFDSGVRERAEALAWSTLRHLTGGMVNNYCVATRPCRKGCGGAQSGPWGVGGYANGAVVPPFQPMLRGGFWYNVTCGCTGDSCHCGAAELCEVTMPGYVADIRMVVVSGMELDPSAYRLDNGRVLVRQDGDCWPKCQDLTQPWDGDAAFTIIYTPGIKPGIAGEWAAGVLAAEFAKACSGAKCRLPSSVTSIARQGVSMEFSTGMFPGGMTGIREVDAFVLGVNPNHLVKPPLVWSPDRQTTSHRFTETGGIIPPGPFGPEFGPEFMIHATP